MGIKPLKSITFPGLPDTYTVDPGLSEEAKAALLACFQHVAWIDEHGGSYYNALRTALYSEGGSTPVIPVIPVIGVTRGIGTSGIEIVANENRMLSDPIPFTNTAPITVQVKLDSNSYTYNFKFTDVNNKIIPTDDIRTPDNNRGYFKNADNSIGVTGWATTIEELTFKDANTNVATVLSTSSGGQVPNGYFRLLFGNAPNASGVLPQEPISGYVIVQGKKYTLEESPVISEYPRLLASYSPPSYFKLYIGDSISILKNFLTVTLYTSASESEVITEYELSGSINNETNVINVTYNGITTSFYAVAEAWTFDSDCLVVGNWILQNTYATYEASSLNRMTLNPLLKRMPIGTYTLSFSNSDYEYGAQFAIAATPKLFEASETLLTEGTESTVWTGSSLTKNLNVSGFPGGYQTGNRTFEITDPECFMVLNIRKKDLSNITASLKQQIKSALTIIKTA